VIEYKSDTNLSIMKKYSYFNGKIVALKNIKISPYDIGLLRGYGVFDVMRTQNSKPFLLAEHWQRLKNSAKDLGLNVPIAKERYKKIVERLLKLNGFKKSIVRTVVTGGYSDNGFSYQPGKETFIILMEKFIPLPKEIYARGAGVITQKFSRYRPQAKITNYVEAIRNQSRKKAAGALEIVYIENGKILEASTSNIFMVKDGAVITPKDEILIGITRNLVIKLAKKNKLKCEERNISEKELFSADEVFLTATTKNIVPVVKIDNKKIGNGRVGPVTKSLINQLEKFVKNY